MNTTILGALAAATLLTTSIDSGLSVGEITTPFHPTHVSGPDKGTKNCPPCTYGNRPAVRVWVNGDDSKNVASIAKLLHESVEGNMASEFKGFVIFLSGQADAEALAKETGYEDIASTFIAKDSKAVAAYKINLDPEVKNTILVYKDKKVSAKFVNFVADKNGLAELTGAIDAIAN
ncbi:MAG: hypothetical protein H0W86_06800 [Armatimonadetes bacterium]|nr:hypothetical protein [Armatimonadota bacterium]